MPDNNCASEHICPSFQATITMKAITLALASLAFTMAAATPVPAAEPDGNRLAPRQDRGSYTVSGLGARKKAITACGGSSLDIAIAMLETERMSTDYTYGDGKTYDSANFGVFKQNWGMLRKSVNRYKSKTVNDWNTGAELNYNLCLDVSSRKESQNYYGEHVWFAGHRNGETGLNNPNTQDIQNYKNAIYWIQSQLTGNNLTNDIRFWVNVPAI